MYSDYISLYAKKQTKCCFMLITERKEKIEDLKVLEEKILSCFDFYHLGWGVFVDRLPMFCVYTY